MVVDNTQKTSNALAPQQRLKRKILQQMNFKPH